MGGERAPKELRHAVRAGNLELVKKHVKGGKYTDAISNPKVGSTILFASAQVSFVRLCARRLILSPLALSPSFNRYVVARAACAVWARQGCQAPDR